MLDRLSPRALLLIGIALPIAGCTNPLVDSITVAPTSQSIAVAQSAQFTATGTYGHGANHPTTTSDITNQVAWTSSVPSVATINSAGAATGVSAGATTITATIKGYTGTLTASATLVVSGSSGGVSPGAVLVGLTIIPELSVSCSTD